MPKPVNEPATTSGSKDALNLNHVLVLSSTIEVQSEGPNYTEDVNTNDIVADLNAQRTDKIEVYLEPTVVFENSPADKGGVWSATPVISGGMVDLDIPFDEYVKLPVDVLSVKPDEANEILGRAIGRALRKNRNTEFLNALVTQGTATATDVAATKAAATAEENWAGLHALRNELALDEEVDMNDVVLYVDGRSWSTLTADTKVLLGTVDPREQAARYLEVGQVRVVNLPGDTVAVAYHNRVVATPARLDSLRTIPAEIDWVFCRIKYGTTVLLPNATRVLNATPAAP